MLLLLRLLVSTVAVCIVVIDLIRSCWGLNSGEKSQLFIPMPPLYYSVRKCAFSRVVGYNRCAWIVDYKSRDFEHGLKSPRSRDIMTLERQVKPMKHRPRSRNHKSIDAGLGFEETRGETTKEMTMESPITTRHRTCTWIPYITSVCSVPAFPDSALHFYHF